MGLADEKATNEYDVVVVGGGPVGLMVGCELALARVRVLVVEGRTETDPTIKAFGLHVPTVEALDRRGMLPALLQAQRDHAESLLEALTRRRSPLPDPTPRSANVAGHFSGITISRSNVDFGNGSGEPEPAPDMLPVSQQMLEQVLMNRVRAEEAGVELRRGVWLEEFSEHETGVDIRLDTGERMRCTWLVGADGGHSMVRQAAGFDFPGTDPEITGRQAVVDLEDPGELQPGWNRSDAGLYVYTPLTGRILTVEMNGPPQDRHTPVTLEEFQDGLRRVSKTNVTIAFLRSATRFTDNARQASTYVKGRVVLAGDAAHVHSPFGGQGLNLGIGDAINLGWKLAATVKGWAPEHLLGTYTRERHPIGAWVLDWTRAQIALMRVDPRTESLRQIVGDLVNTGDGSAYMMKRLLGLQQKYDLPGGHPLTGCSAPDLQLEGRRRLAEVMHGGQGVLVGAPRLADAAASHGDRLVYVKSPNGTAMLVRPDGYVAWASDDLDDLTGLEDATRTWLGEPAHVAR
ncbi:FAD-dependent oxidoreductase [Actinomadura sp. KC06]|uniref:FAD-dependent monooxygenase n=1 Tax=Actinomadura sp. KC06 TaxID=2530369 RepID=UPI0010539BB7|nr:FAD-dependent monooxygenase [Actinomadura sp. KC06]TDD28771.1 FAD-dependent oxidoreductase [Actinomadura sp. KC06]